MARRPVDPLAKVGKQLLKDGKSLLKEGESLIANAEKLIKTTFAFRRLSPAELLGIGVSPKSRRYIRSTTKRVTKQTKTISARQYETRRNKAELGKRVSKEKRTKLLASGQLQYRNQHTANIEQFKRIAREIRRDIDGITPKDVALIIKFKKVGYHGLTPEDEIDPIIYEDEQEEFRRLFKRYSRDHVLPALGSPIVIGVAA